MATSEALSSFVNHLRRRCGDAPADGDLLAQFAVHRDEAAFAELVHRHGGMIFGVARRHLPDRHAAEDIVQATFAALARSAARLGRPPSLVNWLYTVALRQARKARLRFARGKSLLDRLPPPANPIDPLAEVSGRELVTIIDDELSRLPAVYRLPLLLCALEGLSREEAARRLGWPIGSVKGRLERGREILRTRLAKRGLTVPAVLVGGLLATPNEALSAGLVAVVTRAAVHLPVATIPLKLLAVAGIALLALGVGTGVALMPSGQPPLSKSPPPLTASPAVDRYGDPLPPGAVARLGTLRYRAGGQITCLSAVPDAKQAAFCSGDAIEFMDLQTGKIVQRFNSWTRPVAGRDRPIHFAVLAFAPDGRTFAVGSHDAEWSVKQPADVPPMPFWLGDAATGARIRMFEGHNERLLGLAVLAGGQQVVSLADDGVARVWNSARGAKVHDLTRPGHKLTSLAASGDGKIIASGGAVKDGAAAVFLWDSSNGKLLQTLSGHRADVKAVAFAPDGRTLASGDNATVRLWDVTTGREVRKLLGHATKRGTTDCSIYSLAFNTDGRTIASASTDNTIRAWTVATGNILDEVTGYAGTGDLAFADARSLLIGSGQTLLRRDVVSRTFSPHDGPRWWMALLSFTPDGRSVVTADPESPVRTWDAADGRLLSAKDWNPMTICTLVAPGGRWIAFTEDDAGQPVTCIGEVTSGRVVWRLSDKDQQPATFSGDGRVLATLPATRSEKPEEDVLKVWDTTTGAKIGQISGGEMSIETLAFGPNGRTLFGTQMNKPFVRQWEVATGRIVREYALPKGDSTHDVAVSIGGRRMAADCSDGQIRLWDVATGHECWQSRIIDKDHMPFANALTFSPDGLWLASEYEGQGRIDIWDARTGKLVTSLRGHGGQVIRIAFSPDGRRLASTSTD